MNASPMPLVSHLMMAPLLLPLLAASLLLLMSERHTAAKAAIGLAATVANLVVALLLLARATQGGAVNSIGIYLPSNWDMPFGIVLVLDRLSALMLVLAGGVALMALLFALARWHKAGAHFQALLQIQIMGLNGAFLTGDLFNLFVFFEVMLAASYSLLLHGSGPARVKAGLNYIAINLLASSLFLVGASLIYGVTGTLNMADLALKIPLVAPADRALLHAGCAILAVAFLAKAAMWPLNFWLVPAYAAASGPSAAVFALLTKVGVYVLLRLSTLLFSVDAGGSAGFGSAWLFWGGLATLAFGALGLLSAQRPARLAGFAVIVSSGTLMAVLGLARPELTAAALVYLPGSTLALAAFFLLAELMDRTRAADPTVRRAPEDEEDHLPFRMAQQELTGRGNLDDDERELVGQQIPAATALLGAAFIVTALMVAGLPPLAGFIGKFALLSALLNTADAAMPAARWALFSLIVVSGLFALIALSRVGMRFFWAPVDRAAPLLRVIEYLPVALLLAACVALTVHAEALTRYARATASALHQPQGYIDAVFSARPLPGPTRVKASP